MNFFDAINAHVAWKLRLRNYIDGTSEEALDPQIVGRDDHCPLGQWIYTHLDSHGNKPLFRQVQVQHADFHRCAAEIIETVDNKMNDVADMLLGHDYAQLSHMIIKSLTKLDKELNETPA